MVQGFVNMYSTTTSQGNWTGGGMGYSKSCKKWWESVQLQTAKKGKNSMIELCFSPPPGWAMPVFLMAVWATQRCRWGSLR